MLDLSLDTVRLEPTSVTKKTVVAMLATAVATAANCYPTLAQVSNSPAVQLERNLLGQLVGQVTNQAGQPIEDARVVVRGTRQGDEVAGLFREVVFTDDSGAFELEGGLPGRLAAVGSPPRLQRPRRRSLAVWGADNPRGSSTVFAHSPPTSYSRSG